MKVKELIELLSEQDPEKEVLIQQGQGDGNEYDYMRAHNVRKIEIVPYIDDENVDESQEIEAVVIDYE